MHHKDQGEPAHGGAEDVGDAPEVEGIWRWGKASRATVIVDAQAYFEHMQQAMLGAKYRIFMIGWDFDTRIHLAQGRRWYQKFRSRTYPSRLGSFILWLNRHRPSLEIRILRWGYAVGKMVTRGSMIVDLARWFRHRRIDFKFDTAHPPLCSHHQKIVVIDNHLAVCGGIDMTTHRWDTREHREHDPRRKRPRGKMYGPWHDTTMMVEGEAASLLDDLGRDRWARAGGTPLVPIERTGHSAWPDDLTAQFEDVEIGIARTRAEYKETPAVTEIADLFEAHIAAARHFIYAESQYFASRRIAEAIISRLEEDDPPEIVIVHPANADGWLEQQAMDHARVQLVRAIGEVDTKNRFKLYVPYTGETPIYVHAKLMIVDDKILRIGSANMNNRSLGLDSECDLVIDSRRDGNGHAAGPIAALRHSLLGEHLGIDAGDIPNLIEQYGSMHALIAERGKSGTRSLRLYEVPDINEVEAGLADSGLLDPEEPDEMFEPLAKRGLFRGFSPLKRARAMRRRRKGKNA